jgi:thiamine pyrophosphokinase
MPAQGETMERSEQPAVTIFTGGPAPDPVVGAWVVTAAAAGVVVAADEGVDHALALGVVPEVSVGDFDSVSPDGLAALEALGTQIIRHPPDKEATDLELALTIAVRMAQGGPVVVVGSAAGRLDHLAAQMSLLASPEWAPVPLTAYLGSAALRPIHAGSTRALHGVPGGLVTLLPVGGSAGGVTTTGLRFGLDGSELIPWSTRGVSNEFVAPVASVTVGAGVVMAIVPDEADRVVINTHEQ